jgi:hypothetical protein
MKPRALLTFTLLACLLLGGPALAQSASPVAKLADMVGDVLVSRGDAMVAGANGMPLTSGTRVVTTAGAKVTIAFDFGCDVRLNENSRFTVTTGADCAALAKEVVVLGPAPGAIGGGVAAAVPIAPTGGFMVGAAIVGGLGYGAYEVFRSSPSVSPN